MLQGLMIEMKLASCDIGNFYKVAYKVVYRARLDIEGFYI